MKQQGLLDSIKQNKKSSQIKAYITSHDTPDDVVTREFRVPLTVIHQHCRELIEKFGGTLEEQCREYLVDIDRQTVRMSEQVDLLLDSSQNARREATAEPVDLAEISKVIIESLMLTHPERRVKFITAVSVLVTGEARLLRIALRNLLRHAWRNTSHKEETVIELGISEFEGRPVYFIRDNGIGFDMTEAEQLFCSQAGNDESDMPGFGLDTVKNIIQKHKGKIWAEGKPEEGATCYFTLE